MMKANPNNLLLAYGFACIIILVSFSWGIGLNLNNFLLNSGDAFKELQLEEKTLIANYLDEIGIGELINTKEIPGYGFVLSVANKNFFNDNSSIFSEDGIELLDEILYLLKYINKEYCIIVFTPEEELDIDLPRTEMLNKMTFKKLTLTDIFQFYKKKEYSYHGQTIFIIK